MVTLAYMHVGHRAFLGFYYLHYSYNNAVMHSFIYQLSKTRKSHQQQGDSAHLQQGDSVQGDSVHLIRARHLQEDKSTLFADLPCELPQLMWWPE